MIDAQRALLYCLIVSASLAFPLSQSLMSDPTQPWYSHAELARDRNHVLEAPLDVATSDSSRFILLEASKGMYHRVSEPSSSLSEAEPLFLTYLQMQNIVDGDELDKSLSGDHKSLVAWVGSNEGKDYFVFHTTGELEEDRVSEVLGGDETIRISVLRDFGDRLAERMDAAILSTSNGLVEFHKTHPFCSRCGSQTKPAKAGACRRCTSCKSSVYPRIDVAAIMLITSQCGEYALLGRKAVWPEGRYSTLAGFCEVGETLEQCCAREVQEESGVEVDLESISFTQSQPWPFPRSLMAGFRGKAKQSGGELPKIKIEEDEMQDVRWFKKDYVRARLSGGSLALNFKPNEQEKEFHLPGQSSLATLLITEWTNES